MCGFGIPEIPCLRCCGFFWEEVVQLGGGLHFWAPVQSKPCMSGMLRWTDGTLMVNMQYPQLAPLIPLTVYFSSSADHSLIYCSADLSVMLIGCLPQWKLWAQDSDLFCSLMLASSNESTLEWFALMSSFHILMLLGWHLQWRQRFLHP